MTVQDNLARGERQQFFDVVKAFCIILVILTHCAYPKGFSAQLHFPLWIDTAVPFFMIISGYFGAQSLKNATTLGEAYSFEGILKKLARYTIPFACAFLVQCVILAIQNPSTLSSTDYLRIFLTGGLGPGSYYYPVLLQFVFVFPLIWILVKRKPITGLAICFLINTALEIYKNHVGVSGATYRLVIFRYFFVIALGVFLYCYQKKIHWSIRLLAFLGGGTYLFALSAWGYQPRIFSQWPSTSAISVFYTGAIFFTLFYLFQNKSHPILTSVSVLGKASYHIFLAQMLYFFSFASLVSGSIDCVPLKMLVDVAVSLTLGVLFYYAEKPLTAWVVKKIKTSPSIAPRR